MTPTECPLCGAIDGRPDGPPGVHLCSGMRRCMTTRPTRLLYVPEFTVEFDPTQLRRVWLRRLGRSWILSIGGREAWRGHRDHKHKPSTSRAEGDKPGAGGR